MAPERDERLYLDDIVTAIDRVVDYVREGRNAFLADPRTQDAVLRNIAVIGEAVRGVSETTRNAHPEIPWSKLSGARYRVVNDFRVDLDIIWDIVEAELPPLRHKVADLLPIIKSRLP
jgi:uncharacterized protein with HEPN domain